VKWEKERKKKVASGAAVFLLIWCEQLPLWRRDIMGVKLLAFPSIGAMRCSHASSYMLLCCRGWVVRAPGFA
jgi:hypothetical protein